MWGRERLSRMRLANARVGCALQIAAIFASCVGLIVESIPPILFAAFIYWVGRNVEKDDEDVGP